MSKKCQISGVKPKKARKISFSNKKHLRRQEPNLQWKRFWSEERGCFVRLRVTTRVIKRATKLGLESALKAYGTTLNEAVSNKS